MQAAAPSELGLLKLADPAALFDHPPAGVDGGAIRQALHKAMERVAEAPVQTDAGQRRWLLAEAGRILLADPKQYAAAIHLTQVAAPNLADNAALAHVRLIAMGRLGRTPELLAEVGRLAEVQPLQPRMSFVIKSVTALFRLRLSISPSIALHHAIWGDLPEDLLHKLKTLSSDPGPNMQVPEHALQYLYERSQMERCSFAEFKQRYYLGLVKADYLRFIGGLRTPLGDPKELAKINVLHGQIRNELQLPMHTKPDDRGVQNVLFMAAHVGVMSVLGFHCLPKSELPKSILANAPGPDHGDNFNVATLGSDATLRFLKLVKLVRKGVRRTLIFPDGGSGELAPIKLLGVTMQIGRGAAILGYYGNAITHFISSKWEEEHIRIDLKTGPSPDSQESCEDFAQRLNKFYAECLEGILTGPPENIGGFALKFAHLLSKERNA